MGLGAKKKIYVSSVTYNLAGDEKDHIRYLPTVVLSKIISNSNFDMADSLRNALLTGPGMRTRSFARWARNSGYSAALEMESGKLISPDAIDVDILREHIDHTPEQTVNIDSAFIDSADFTHWADEWMAENMPTEVDGDYSLDYVEASNTILIVFADGRNFSFSPPDFDPLAQYMYVDYTLTAEPLPSPVVWETPVEVTGASDFPSTSGWDVDSSTSTQEVVDLDTVTTTEVTYSDGTPTETTTNTVTTQDIFTVLEASYSKETYAGSSTSGNDELVTNKSYQINKQGYKVTSTESTTTTTETLPGGVIKTTAVTVKIEQATNSYTYQLGTQEIVTKQWSARKTMIYKQFDGNAELDAMFGFSDDLGVYFPFMPVRRDESMISPTNHPDIYLRNKKAYSKAFGRGAKYDELVKNLNSNGSIRDVDHAFVVFGVAANTKNNSALKYIYRYFQSLLRDSSTEAGYAGWKALWTVADLKARAWVSWREAQSDPSHPLYGTPEPERTPYPIPPISRTTVKSSRFRYDMIIKWKGMEERADVGLGRPGAKMGDVWWTVGDTEEFNEIFYSSGVVSQIPSRHAIVFLTWQDSVDTFRTLKFIGLNHANIVYKGKGVNYDIDTALAEVDNTGFIVPLNEAVYRSMSLVDQTEMSQASSYLVLNSYEVVKDKWYQTGLFKVILVIIVIVITYFTAGAGSGLGAGLLGTAASVGAALGFAGTMALIVGAIANALAAMILTQIIMMGSTALFGDKVGAIVGAIASVIAISVGSSMSSGGTALDGLSNAMTAENVLRFTVAAGEGIAAFINDETGQIMKDTQQVIDDYTGQLGHINAEWYKNLGYGDILIDPMMLTEVGKVDYQPESHAMFLNRTLLTGSEVADLTNSLLTNYAAAGISMTLPS